MIGNKVEQSDLVGDIKDFPIEVVQAMVDEQVMQGNKADASVFAKDYRSGSLCGGFGWNRALDQSPFWENVICNKHFELFFTKYPKTNNKMEEEKSIKIQIPDGYEIDEAKSSFTEIKFKPVGVKYPDSWEDAFLGECMYGFYVRGQESKPFNYGQREALRDEKDVFKTEKQAKSSLAYAQLTQLMALPCYNGDWEADWNDDGQPKYVIYRESNQLEKENNYRFYEEIAFKSPEIRDIFLDKYQCLLKTYYQIK